MATILVIDDNEDLRTVVSDVLASAGHEVAQAANGEDGLARQRELSAAVVITDMLMPEKDGVETIRDLAEEFPAVRIIAMTGAPKSASTERLQFLTREMGAVAFLSKPFDPEALLNAVQEALHPR